MEMDYDRLAQAGNEKYNTKKRPVIQYPEGETAEWYGFKRHNFIFEGHNAFIVEPRNPAPQFPWSWCLQWAEAFVPRTPALKLLERGFHHVHIDIFETFASPAGTAILKKFRDYLVSLGLNQRAALIGMSYGGLFSFRWAADYPEAVAVIYADAPVCDLTFAKDKWPEKTELMRIAYGAKDLKELYEHPLSPINNTAPIAEAGIPILCLTGEQDQTVPVATNINIFEERFKADGGHIEMIRRDLYAHHPHGLDDPMPIVDFILQYYPEF